MRGHQKKKGKVIILLLLMGFLLACFNLSYATVISQDLDFSDDELKWINAHQNQVFELGLAPYSGMDYFIYNGVEKGYVVDFTQLVKQLTGLQIEIVGDQSWSEVYHGLQDGSIDILFGANVTEERLKFMSFTEAIHKYPYDMLALKDNEIMTIADVDHKRLGFIEADIAIDLIPEFYQRISYTPSIYPSQQEAVDALLTGEIDAFITNGGSLVDRFLYTYPQLKRVAEIESITSDMTLSTLKDNKTLLAIVDKVINGKSSEIQLMKERAYYEYNWIILDLSQEEVAYIKSLVDPVQIGVSLDYLPFEHVYKSEAGGIFVEYFKQLSKTVGIPFEYQGGEFNTLYNELQSNDIQVMNLAKTEERKKQLLFTDPYSTERDFIFGFQSAPYVGDIYSLEGKRVVAVDGYYQKDYLEKNLNHVEWIMTDNIVDALMLINDEKADYVIENPTVVQYYIDELKLYNIAKKGDMSSDSRLYIAINSDNPMLLSIINKAIPALDYSAIKNDAISIMPHISGDKVAQLGMVIVGLAAFIFLTVIILIRISKNLFNEKTKSKFLEEKQKLLYLDPMTGLKNRQYYNKIETELDNIPFPQVYVVADLNSLKYVNDTHGHFVGDEYITRFSAILLKKLPEKCIVIRMGGDEFLMIIEACTYEEGKRYIQGIHEACNTDSFFETLRMSSTWASFGLQERLDTGLSVTDAIQKADNYMYANKKESKGV